MPIWVFPSIPRDSRSVKGPFSAAASSPDLCSLISALAVACFIMKSQVRLSFAAGAGPTAVGLGMPEHIKKKLLEEISQLEFELTTELPAEIKKARALGDLSENAEYHMAKQRQEFVNARLGQLKRRMAELSLVNLANIPKDKAGFGSTVVVYDSTKDEELVYRLVTSEEADVTKGLISTTSPIGRGIVGKRVGDTATIQTPNGRRQLEILKLTTIHDEADEGQSEAAAGGL